MATSRVQSQVGAAVLGMAMNTAKDQSAALAKLMESTAPVTIGDPALGSNINILA